MDEHRLPEGPLEELLFGGILEWRGGDAHELERIVGEINALGLARAELDPDGGRFSILFDDKPVPGARVTPDVLDRLVDGLQALVDASEDPAGAESTLHCSAIHTGEIVETLIGVEGGVVRPVSRIRPRLIEESADIPVRTVAWKKVVPLGLLLLVGFGLVAWRSGYLDRVFSAAPAEFEVDRGPFGERLRVSITREWGNYVITLRRGASYPATVEAITAERAGAKGIAERAAIDIIAAGGTVYVQLLDANGEVIDSKEVELRTLVEDAKGKAIARIRGRIGAAQVRIALSKGERKQ